MKKILLLLAIVLNFAVANQLTIFHSYQNSVYKAKKADKLILVMMSYKGCPVCNYMRDIVFERPNVLDYLNKHYLVVIKDIERGRYPQRFSVVDSPTFFFIDPKTGKDRIEKKVGGFTPETFLSFLQKANCDIDINATTVIDQNATQLPCKKEKSCQEEAKVTIH